MGNFRLHATLEKWKSSVQLNNSNSGVNNIFILKVIFQNYQYPPQFLMQIRSKFSRILLEPHTKLYFSTITPIFHLASSTAAFQTAIVTVLFGKNA